MSQDKRQILKRGNKMGDELWYCTTTCAAVHQRARHHTRTAANQRAHRSTKAQPCTVKPERTQTSTTACRSPERQRSSERTSGCQGEATTESGTEGRPGDVTATERTSVVSQGGSSVDRASSALARAKARE
jgi:hypothetical protein